MGIKKVTQTVYETDDGSQHVLYEHANLRQFELDLITMFADLGIAMVPSDIVHLRDNYEVIINVIQMYKNREFDHELE